MKYYECHNGDRIDLIVLKHYGDSTHLNDVIGANKQLFNKSMNLESGMIIELPDFSVSEQQSKNVTVQATKREPLW